MCSYERVAWLTEILVGKTEISVSGLENFATGTLHPGFQDEFFAILGLQLTSYIYAN